MDWVRVYDSHTLYEWTVQTALNIVDPWGDDRADMRSEAHALAVIGPCEETIENLHGFIEINRQEPEVGPAVIRQLLEG